MWLALHILKRKDLKKKKFKKTYYSWRSLFLIHCLKGCYNHNAPFDNLTNDSFQVDFTGCWYYISLVPKIEKNHKQRSKLEFLNPNFNKIQFNPK